jgi:multiple sugar transport system permease protein
MEVYMKVKDTAYEEAKHPVLKKIIKYKTAYLMMAPFFLLFFLFTVLPVVISMGLSFTNFNMLEWPKF